jgi:hypothetical protein
MGSSRYWAGAPARPCMPHRRRQPAIRHYLSFDDPSLQVGAWRDPMFACSFPSCLQHFVRTQSLPLFFWRPAAVVVQDKDLHSAARPRASTELRAIHILAALDMPSRVPLAPGEAGYAGSHQGAGGRHEVRRMRGRDVDQGWTKPQRLRNSGRSGGRTRPRTAMWVVIEAGR